jgi:hypothetical protein
MPAVLAAQPGALTVASVYLNNPAPQEAGYIMLDGLSLRAGDEDHTPLLMGEVIAVMTALVEGEVWAISDALAADDTFAVLIPAVPLQVLPGSSVTLDLQVEFRTGTSATSFRVGVASDDVNVVQPDEALLTIRIEPASGSVFPLWTEAGHFTGLSLSGSYANFPNPFAAGREATTFVFSLRDEATVTLQIMTVRGEKVMTLVSSESRAAGLYQEDVWDGLNGRGVTVRNGVYVAELIAKYVDGTSDRVLRKVAVLR